MRALISVSDKTKVVWFASQLVELGFEIIATGGTKKVLEEAGIKVIYVEDVTHSKEILDGRVKTLHPAIHGALLARRDLESHMVTLKENNITPIDLVCVNLYPFKKTIEKENVTLEEAIENIDIGGPSMLRSAAKNNKSVYAVCDPNDYEDVINHLKAKEDDEAYRLYLASKVFSHTASYDMMISTYLEKISGNNNDYFIHATKVEDLRYGENPHQKATFYKLKDNLSYSLANAKQLHGKALSYNNIQDANAALMITSEFKEPFAVAVKHMNPCGASLGNDIVEAFKKAYEADPVSIFGGIVALNREVNLELANLLKPIFLEVVIAPSFSEDAFALLAKKKNIRLMTCKMDDVTKEEQFTFVNGGLLVQDLDNSLNTLSLNKEMNVTTASVDEKTLKDLDFAFKIVKHVKSNAIVLAKDGTTCGVGAGQMNRIGSLEIAYNEALSFKHNEDLVLASDGFFPFDDCAKFAVEHGIKAIVQPGGSVRDQDSITVCNEANIPMLFTGRRHFKH